MAKFGTWTPIEAEKPPLFEPVIITRIDKYGRRTSDSALYLDDGEWRIRGASEKDKLHAVIGWMPYPRPMEVQKNG